MDMVLYNRSYALAARLYNQGLNSLKNANIHQGIAQLTKSLAINKNNPNARNLLGLALFNVGNIGDAIAHWAISASISPADNLATDYLARADKNQQLLEKYNDSITMYNSALGHLKQKSNDLAIIRLKKAVEINPRFIDALNLLTLCHILQNEKDRAAAMAERVLAIDIANPIALNYHAFAAPKRAKQPRPKAPKAKATYEVPSPGPYKGMGMGDKKERSFHLAEIFAFIIGAVSAVAILYFLMFPAIQREHEAEIARIEGRETYVEEAHQAEIDALMAQKQALEQIIAGQDATLDEFALAQERQERINTVHHAYFLYQEDNLHESIQVLDQLQADDLPLEVRNLITTIREGAYPRLQLQYANAGVAAHTANNYEQALEYMTLSMRFSVDGTPLHRADFLFALGSVYYNADRLEEALEVLTTLQSSFRNHRPQGTATMINRIRNRLD